MSLFVIIWLLGTVASFAVNGYFKGRAQTRFERNQGVTENPPWIIGQLTSPFWPIQAVLGLIMVINFFSTRTGRGAGYAVNEELHALREFHQDFKQHEARTFAMLQNAKIDPLALDDNTTRALTARSIEWAMEDDAKVRREAAGLVKASAPEPEPALTDDMLEILDRCGVKIPDTPAAQAWHDRTKGELDL